MGTHMLSTWIKGITLSISNLNSVLKLNLHVDEDAKPVFQIPVGLPCLERGRLVKKGEICKNLLILLTLNSEFVAEVGSVLRYLDMFSNIN